MLSKHTYLANITVASADNSQITRYEEITTFGRSTSPTNKAKEGKQNWAGLGQLMLHYHFSGDRNNQDLD